MTFSKKAQRADALHADFKKEMAELFLLLNDASVPEERKAKARAKLAGIETALEGHLAEAKGETKEKIREGDKR